MFYVVVAFASTRKRNFKAVFPQASLAKGTRRIAEKEAVTIFFFQHGQAENGGIEFKCEKKLAAPLGRTPILDDFAT